MAKKVDFKKVAEHLRFDVLGSFKMKTPSEFEQLSEQEKLEFYSYAFDLHHDCCRFLSAYLEVDDLNEHYSIND